MHSGPATVQTLTTAGQGADLRVEIILSAPVKPSFETASNPDRILLDLPDTHSNDASKKCCGECGWCAPRTHRAAQHEPAGYASSPRPRSDPSLHGKDGREPDRHHDKRRENAQKDHTRRASSGNFGQFDWGVPSATRDSDTTPGTKFSGFPAPFPPASTAGPAFEPASNNSSVAAVPTTPLTAPQSQSQPRLAQRPAQQAGASGAATDDSRAEAVAPACRPLLPQLFLGFSSNPYPRCRASRQVAVPVTTKNEEPAALAASAPAISPSPAPEKSTVIARSDDPSLRTIFKVKYVAEGVAYLEGGRAQGLKEGMKLEVEETNVPATQGDSASAADPHTVAELEVCGC